MTPEGSNDTANEKVAFRVSLVRLAAVVLIGALLWVVPVPFGVEPRAWRLLAIFVATIVGVILRPIPDSLDSHPCRCLGVA